VLTFEHQGRDERAAFSASRVWFHDKRLGAKQELSDVLCEGDTVTFEAIPAALAGMVAETASREVLSDIAGDCSYVAQLVWRGPRRPNVSEEDMKLAEERDESEAAAAYSLARQGSGSSWADEVESSYEDGGALINGFVNEGVIRGVGMIARLVDDKSGILWWFKAKNHLQSVWFERKRCFLFGANLAEKNLRNVFKEGDPVTFVAEKPSDDFPCKWMAKQVTVNGAERGAFAKLLGKNATPSREEVLFNGVAREPIAGAENGLDEEKD